MYDFLYGAWNHPLPSSLKAIKIKYIYMCFHNDIKTTQSTKCIKSMVITKVVDSVLSIVTFEQKHFVLKGVLQSPHLKCHVKNIGINQSLNNNAFF